MWVDLLPGEAIHKLALLSLFREEILIPCFLPVPTITDFDLMHKVVAFDDLSKFIRRALRRWDIEKPGWSRGAVKSDLYQSIISASGISTFEDQYT